MSLAQYLQLRITLLVRYTQQLFARFAFFRQHQHPAGDANQKAKPVHFDHKRPRYSLV
jgi:hypothetical protein